MAVIAPDTVVKVLSGVPFDRGYAHTLYFASESAQTSFMNSKADHTWTDFTYVRAYGNRIRVPIHPDAMYDCNYLMFQNSNFGDKWFYAFITELNYINNECTEIVYEIDVIQTWWFRFHFGDCYIERTHVDDDSVFHHTIDEGLGTGEYTVDSKNNIAMGDMSVCILAGQGQHGGKPAGRVVNNVWCPLEIYTVKVSNDSGLRSIFNNYQQSGGVNSIASVFEYPSWLGNSLSTEVKHITSPSMTYDFTSIGGYQPRHKKLFCYPYNFLVLTNNMGQSSVLKFELFDNPNSIQFRCSGTFFPQPSILCYPEDYRGVTHDFDSGVMISSFPQCPVVNDGYLQYSALNRYGMMMNTGAMGNVSDAMGVLTSALGMVAGASAGNPMSVPSGTSASLGNIANLVGGREIAENDLQAIPNSVHGQTSSDLLNVAYGGSRNGFSIYRVRIRAEMARKLDEYFDIYGYKTMRVQKPDFTRGSNHTYIKTAGAIVYGDKAPSDAKERMAQILNNGIIFFRSESGYGNVTVSN